MSKSIGQAVRMGRSQDTGIPQHGLKLFSTGRVSSLLGKPQLCFKGLSNELSQAYPDYPG